MALFAIVLTITFNVFVLFSIIYFMTQVYRNINQSISLMQGNPLYDNILHQAKFRRALMIACHTIVVIYYFY